MPTELKDNIRVEISHIKTEELRRVAGAFLENARRDCKQKVASS
jgi:hypothetical protein